MNRNELNQWLALMSGIDTISERCIEEGVDFFELDLRPLAIRKFIKATAEELEELHRQAILKQGTPILQSILPNILKLTSKG